MGGEVCYKKGRERGPWYEVKTLVETKSASKDFKLRFLKSWRKFPGYKKYCDDAINTLTALVENQKIGGENNKLEEYHSPRIKKPEKQGVLI